MSKELTLPKDLLCGYFDCSTFGYLKVSPNRVSTLFEIEYFLEDGKSTYSNDTVFPIRRGWAYICTPGEVRYSDLPFKTKYVKFSAEGTLAEMLLSAPRYFRVYQSNEALALLDDIISLYSVSSPDENILLQGKLLSYIALILEESKRSKAVDSYKNKIAIKAQDFIKEHYGESIKLADIAKEVSLTPNYFHTLFSEVCKITPREYLLKQRLTAAKRLLLITEMSISEISEQCGFKTQQYLTSVFKSHFDCSPAEFRRRHQNSYFID